MIRHVVLFSARDPADVSVIESGLALLSDIPAASHLEVGRNVKADSASSEIDVVVYAEFDDDEALRKFKAHPLYDEAIRRVRGLRDVRVVADWHAERALGRAARSA